MPDFDPSKMGRVLIVRLSAIGDILHGLPVARALKAWRPGLELIWLVEDRFACLLRNVSELDEVIEVPRAGWRREGGPLGVVADGWRLGASLRQRRFDASLDLQGLTKSGLWPWLGRVPVRIGFGDEQGRELNRWLCNVKVVPGEDCRHVVERNLALLEPLGVERPEADLSIPVDEAAEESVEQLRRERGWGEALALLQPGAGWETKRWPVEYFAQLGDWLARRWRFRVVVLWGPGEKELAEAVAAGMAEAGELAPETNLLELVELIRGCRLFVGGDTGPMHMAAALGVPTVAIFGASDPVRNGPYGEGHLVLYQDLECRPCWRTRCESPRCLKELGPEGVIARVEEYLAGKKESGVRSQKAEVRRQKAE